MRAGPGPRRHEDGIASLLVRFSQQRRDTHLRDKSKVTDLTTLLVEARIRNDGFSLDSASRTTNRCLESYRRFRTSERHVAEAEAAKLLAPHRLQFPAEQDMDAVLCWAEIGSVSLCLIDYHSPFSIDRPSQNEYMAVISPLSGAMNMRHHKQELVTRPHGSQAVVSWGDSLHMDVSAECALLSLRADVSALTQALRNLVPEAEGPLQFETAVDNPLSYNAISGAMQMMTSVLDNFGSIEAIPPHLCRQLREQALNTILLAVPHNHSAHIFRPRPPCRRAVREAMDLIESESIGELTVADVAKCVGVGVRALEIGFQHELHCTPRTFIQNMRMERAHRDLLESDPCDGATVTNIALRWGFAHTGRFATTYRRRYGISPSHTLRQTDTP